MSVITQKKYNDGIQAAAADELTQQKRLVAVEKLLATQKEAMKQFSNAPLAQKRLSYARLKVLEELDRYLIQFEKKYLRGGGKIFWANTAADAIEKIKNVTDDCREDTVVYQWSKLLQETGLLNQYGKREVPPSPGDTVSLLASLTNEKYSHHVYGLMDQSPEDIHELLRQRYYPEEDVVGGKALSRSLRKELAKTVTNREVVISGADFLVADSGAIGFCSDNGERWLATSTAKTHIIIAGIDQLIPTMDDIEVLLPLKAASSGIGETYPVYDFVFGPARKNSLNGPQEVILILLNNGRTTLLQNSDIRNILTCIHCGACQNLSPVYRVAGTAAYNIPYSGPYGVVTAHAYHPDTDVTHLNYATTLGHKISSRCPAGINLREMILYNRNAVVRNDQATPEMRRYIRNYKFFTLSRKRMNFGGPAIRNMVVKRQLSMTWGNERAFPKIAAKNFSQLYHHKKKS